MMTIIFESVYYLTLNIGFQRGICLFEMGILIQVINIKMQSLKFAQNLTSQ